MWLYFYILYLYILYFILYSFFLFIIVFYTYNIQWKGTISQSL